jgi:hypothetical protein
MNRFDNENRTVTEKIQGERPENVFGPLPITQTGLSREKNKRIKQLVNFRKPYPAVMNLCSQKIKKNYHFKNLHDGRIILYSNRTYRFL